MNERLSYKSIYDDNQKRLEVCYYTKDKLVERIVELSAECEKLEKMLRSK